MDTRDYPGKGLSLSQLVFALKEELKHASYSPSFTLDNVSQLDQDISTALAAAREWRNSFAPINRAPLDILSLIPTHLSQEDRFRATFVCRHWRSTFLQCGRLWSRLRLVKGEIYVKTLLERVKGSPLHIRACHRDPTGVIALLTPHTKQIRYLNLMYNHWANIQRFSEVNPGPFPLLRILVINAVGGIGLDGPDMMIPPSLPLFSNAVDLKEFRLHSETSSFLSHFVFPNLTVFKLSAAPVEGFHTSELLNFLEASPMLRTVHMRITADISFEGVPREKLVVLPNVKTLSLVMSDGGPGYKIAAHIACPSAKLTSLMHEKHADDMIPDEIFPAPVSWNAIVGQCTTSPVEGVTLEIKVVPNCVIECSLTFQSHDATILKLGFKVAANGSIGWPGIRVSFSRMYCAVFSQASRTIRDHPLLANVKRLLIHYHNYLAIGSSKLHRIANDIGRLFKSMGSLEELYIHRADLRPYLYPFLDLPGLHSGVEQLVVFPPIKELIISDPWCKPLDECVAGLVGLAKSQHALGVPFKNVTVHMEDLPAAMAEELSPWVGTAHFYNEGYAGDGGWGLI